MANKHFNQHCACPISRIMHALANWSCATWGSTVWSWARQPHRRAAIWVATAAPQWPERGSGSSIDRRSRWWRKWRKRSSSAICIIGNSLDARSWLYYSWALPSWLGPCSSHTIRADQCRWILWSHRGFWIKVWVTTTFSIEQEWYKTTGEWKR